MDYKGNFGPHNRNLVKKGNKKEYRFNRINKIEYSQKYNFMVNIFIIIFNVSFK